MLAPPFVRDLDERTVAGDLVAYHCQLHSRERVIRCISCCTLRIVQRLFFLPDQLVVQPVRPFLGGRLNEGPLRKIDAFASRQKILRLHERILLGE